MRDRITLGINMYKVGFEYKYIVSLLKKFGFKAVRTSISVPNQEVLRNKNALEYFHTIKDDVLSFYYSLLEEGIMPFYDCNERKTLKCAGGCYAFKAERLKQCRQAISTWG